MLCDQCRERDAVVHLTQIVGQSVAQVHLCERCAAERGIETTVAEPKHPLGDFLQAVQQQASQLPGDLPRCAYCGTSLQEFRASGRLGCAHCYAAFDQSLRELLRRVHGATRHAGWRPPPVESVNDGELPTADPASRVEALREELARAVAAEAFESAAALRDQIRALE
ncbi:MAG: UvrB/UvrC motif-containing protein [Gemmatimonadota bacterium]|jgi:protein arginine kinase activator|nr:UvrB/UvrC motif-containing protein [Gemmatimonadota bacterium]MDQ8146439.1 UvrB/UvrC motif-containing protein [Gemmatimonadota bacterium]MDQ8148366.1 UvrB/UvrC motif-containing protein [Gemmatimonadota bacterium]MDQ8156172.1 UvrB/UvrC motif-containing protein [Gemmatimonadota bacterium]MDQ8176157.1 UvrB/UvrC motif-containing protein [Gemmatimonadota bacterium]